MGENDMLLLPEDVQSLLSQEYSGLKLCCQTGAITILEGIRRQTSILEMVQLTSLNNPTMVRYLRKDFDLCAADAKCPIHAIDAGPCGSHWIQRFSNHGKSLYQAFINSDPYAGGPEGLNVISHALPPIMHRDKSELLHILETSVELCSEVAALHAERIIHNSINPFVVYISQNRLVLHGKSLFQDTDDAEGDNIFQGQNLLPYLSPESSDRTNRMVDHRSDIYSIGCTLFELIIGRPPYIADDALTYIHRHLTLKPPRIDRISPGLPPELGAILYKCLEKSPEARYQTVIGLKYDLEHVITILTTRFPAESDQPFELGYLDQLLKFSPDLELCGRESEAAILTAAWQSVKIKHQTSIVVLSGASGLGKSRLAGTLKSQIQTSMYAGAKYEQFQRGAPYYALILTLQNLVRQLLTESTADMQGWRNRLLKNREAVSVLIQNVPEVQVLLGHDFRPDRTTEIGIQEARLRFHSSFCWMLSVFAAIRPVVIFQDDVQWASQTEVDLISEIALQVPNLLMILTRRPSAIPDLIDFAFDVVRTNVPVVELKLENLHEVEVTEIVIRALHGQSSPESTALSHFVFTKTKGNPFFVIQLLKTLHRSGKIYFQVNEHRWRFDIKTISEEELTKDIIDIIIAEMKILNQNVQQLLVTAAALGQERFSTRTLCIATGLSLDTVSTMATTAIDHNIFKRCNVDNESDSRLPYSPAADDIYSFLHDRTQETAYMLRTPEEQVHIHYQVATNMQKYYLNMESVAEDNRFVLANQFNKCLHLLTNTERITALECNLSAGKYALNLSDAVSGLYYFQVADYIQEQVGVANDVKLQIRFQLIEANLASNEYEQVLALVTQTLQYSNNQRDRTHCYISRMKALIAQSNMDAAITTGLDALADLNCPVPPSDAGAAIFAQKMAESLHHNALSIEKLHLAPPLTDEILLLVQEVLTIIVLPVYMTKPLTLPALCYLSLSITTQKGPSIAGAYPAMMLGAYLCSLGGMQNLVASHAYGRFALTMLESSSKLETIAPGMYHLFAGHIAVFHSPMSEVMRYEDLAISSGKTLFNVEYTVFSLVEKPLFQTWSGTVISRGIEELKMCSNYVQNTKSKASNCFLAVHLQGLGWLADEATEAQALCEYLGTEDPSETIKSALSITHAFMTEMWVLLCAYFSCDHSRTRLAIRRCCHDYIDGVLGTYYVTVALYISVVSLLAMKLESVELNESELMIISKAASVLSDYAKLTPSTYQAKSMLIDILYCRQSGEDQLKVLDKYDEAIAVAESYNCLMDAAIILESASRWLESISNKRSQSYMQRAYDTYHAWGALRKTKQLKAEFSWLNRTTAVDIVLRKPMVQRQETNRTTESVTDENVWPTESLSSGSRRPSELVKTHRRPCFQRSGLSSEQPLLNEPMRPSLKAETSEARSLLEESNNMLSELDLKTVLNASIQISQGMKAEEVFESLMQTVILAAGADYGILALYTSDVTSPELAVHTVARNDSIELLRNTLAHDSPNLLPLSVVGTVVTTQKSIIRDEMHEHSFDHSFGKDRYFLGREDNLRSVLCMPITSTSEKKCRGILYLENNETSSAFTAQRLECLTLLCTQSAMTLERAAVYHELRAAKAQAEEATAQKSTFLANMSHEIRTPFNALLSCAIFLLDTGLTQIQKDYVTTIRDSATLTLGIIDGILDFSKVEQGMMDLVFAPFSLSQNIETAMQVVAEKASRTGVDLVYSRKHKNDSLIGDSHHLRQVILNLLGNAVKFTSDGFVKVTSSIKEQVDDIHQVLLISVQDTGIGISPKGIDRLFKAFSQVDASINRSYGGTGLGLAISKKLIELMQGTVRLESIEGSGSTFFVELPLELDLHQPNQVDMDIAESEKLREQGRLALVISRFPETAAVLMDDLSDIGLTPHKNTDILDADSIATAAKERPYSILFVDLQVDGALDLVGSLQKILPSAESHFKIVILTHYGLNVPKGLSSERISGYLVKPIIKKKLKVIVSETFDSIWGDSDQKEHKPKSGMWSQMEPENTSAASTGQKQFKSLRILLAEDNIINTRMAIQHLKRLGHTTVTHAKDGIEVLEHVEQAVTNQNMFDIILMDVQMPRLDGVGATRELLKRYPLRSQRPVIIALTANATMTDKEECINAGMSGHISKPILPDELLRTLNAIRRRASVSLASSVGESEMASLVLEK